MKRADVEKAVDRLAQSARTGAPLNEEEKDQLAAEAIEAVAAILLGIWDELATIADAAKRVR